MAKKISPATATKKGNGKILLKIPDDLILLPDRLRDESRTELEIHSAIRFTVPGGKADVANRSANCRPATNSPHLITISCRALF